MDAYGEEDQVRYAAIMCPRTTAIYVCPHMWHAIAKEEQVGWQGEVRREKRSTERQQTRAKALFRLYYAQALLRLYYALPKPGGVSGKGRERGNRRARAKALLRPY